MTSITAADIKPEHFAWSVEDKVATISLNRPERKNPLTFESYAELRDTFHKLQWIDDVKVVVITGEGGNFCSGGDVHEIIGPLTKMDMEGLLNFTRMTGDLVKPCENAHSRSLRQSMVFAPARVLSWQWQRTYVTAHQRVWLAFCLLG